MSFTLPPDANGILPDRMIAAMADAGLILPAYPFVESQIQPASLDLRLGDIAYRVRASFLPGPGATVAERIDELKLHEIDLTDGAVLETNCVYIVPLLESLALPPEIVAAANPKSSTGRLDVFTRVIADGTRRFDMIGAGYHGPLYAEISPKTFPVLLREGSRLSQVRFRTGDAILNADELDALHDAGAAGRCRRRRPRQRRGAVSVDLSGENANGFVGYRAKRHTGVVDIDRRGGYAVDEFWEPIAARPDGSLILDPGEFYILASKEAVQVPPDYAAEMVPFDPLVGEFRVHYAGFFDPGFGYAGAGGQGSRAVLEVRSREVPFILEHGQIVGRLVYEKMLARPDAMYGQRIGSNYQAQGLKLIKAFSGVARHARSVSIRRPPSARDPIALARDDGVALPRRRLRRRRHAPHRVADIVGHQQRALLVDRGRRPAGPGFALVVEEAGQHVLRLAGGLAVLRRARRSPCSRRAAFDSTSRAGR